MKTARTVLVATVAMLALTETQQVSAAPDTSTSTTAHAAKRIVLTNADSGRTVSAAIGDTVDVRLTSVREGAVTWVFDKPVSSDISLAKPMSGAVRPDGSAVASFEVAAATDVVLSAMRRCVVSAPGGVCPPTVTPWKVTLDLV